MIQPKVAGEYLKAGLGRWLPAIPSIVKNDPWWTDPQGSAPARLRLSRACSARRCPYLLRLQSRHGPRRTPQQIWGTAHASVIRDNVSPEAAAEAALKQIGDILAKYPIAQSLRGKR